MKKIFIVRKFVVADSVSDALAKEKDADVADCWLDEHSQKELKEELTKRE